MTARLSLARAGLRSWLGWLLIASLTLSAWTLRWPGRQALVEAESKWSPNDLPRSYAAGPSTIEAGDQEIDRAAWSLDVGNFDPFVGVVPPPVPRATPAPAPALVALAPAPAPVAPPRPVLEARFAGRMLGPNGQAIVYLRSGDSVVPVSEGSVLPGGFIVAAVLANEVQLRHPNDVSQTPYVVAIPSTGGSDR